MADHYEIDKIMNLTGLPVEELPHGETATWGDPETSLGSAVWAFRSKKHYNAVTSLSVFLKIVTIMKNQFYEDIANRTAAREGLIFDEEELTAFARTLDQKGFGKTLLVGDYKDPRFMGLVDSWCREHGYFILYPFSFACSLDVFVGRQLVLYNHPEIC